MFVARRRPPFDLLNSALFELYLFKVISHNLLTASIDVEGACAVIRRFRHEEDHQQQHEDKGTTHAMHRDAI